MKGSGAAGMEGDPRKLVRGGVVLETAHLRGCAADVFGPSASEFEAEPLVAVFGVAGRVFGDGVGRAV